MTICHTARSMLLFHLDSFPTSRPNDTHARIPMPCDPQPWSLFIPISSTMPSHFSPFHHTYTSSGGLSSPSQNLDLSSSTPPTKVSLPRQNPQTHPNPTATRPAEGVFHKMQELEAVVPFARHPRSGALQPFLRGHGHSRPCTLL